MKFSFQIKLIKSRPKALATLCILFTSIICVGLLGITIYEGNKSYLINQCKSNALDIASIAADDIDSNIFKIDDFGTGYSSLSMLKDINLDVVKIDKSFLGKNGSVDKQQEKMLENVIKMINDLDRTVICEGIENEKQLNFLKSSDCAIAQGFFFDKPLPHDEFEQRLKNPHYDK